MGHPHVLRLYNWVVPQDTIADMAKDMVKTRTGGSQASAAELYDFMKKVRRHSCACPAVSVPAMWTVHACQCIEPEGNSRQDTLLTTD